MISHKKQKIGIFGLGKTGMSVCKELQNKFDIIAYDDSKANKDEFKEIFNKIPLIPLSDIRWQSLDKIVLSPGIPPTHEIFTIADKFNISIISDIDLLYEKSKNLNFIAVTGTNGKSTTTALISHILNSSGLDYPVAGNIGVPALEAKSGKDGYVLELSSFQLDLVKSFTAKIAVLLNITPDHLDRHKDMQNYIAAKSKIFDRMNKDSYGIINIDNDYCYEVFIKLQLDSQRFRQDEFKEEPAQPIEIGEQRQTTQNSLVSNFVNDAVQQEKNINLIPFSVTKIVEKGISVIDGKIHDNFFDNSNFKLLPNKNLQGTHNGENIAASYAVARIIGLEPATILNAIGNFQSLPHRMQYIGTIKNISFYNDSKATNATAAIQSIKALDNIYWIAGGIAKEGGIEEIKPYFSKIKKAYYYGQAKEMFAGTAKNTVNFVICDNLEQAFELAYKDASKDSEKEKNILLAPCCSSYDQFKNFEERGELFIKLSKKIIASS